MVCALYDVVNEGSQGNCSSSLLGPLYGYVSFYWRHCVTAGVRCMKFLVLVILIL